MDTHDTSYHSTEENLTETMKTIFPIHILRLIQQISELAGKEGFSVYLVGGIVRDLILGLTNVDIDLVVDGDGLSFGALLAETIPGRIKFHERFATFSLYLADGTKIDIASARKETYDFPGALPTVEKGTLKQDLFRRDFTVNAMAISLNGKSFGRLIDYFGGRQDLNLRIIKVLHEERFMDDPTRIFRSVRFEKRYGFTIEAETFSFARKAVEQNVFENVSFSRLKEELLLVLKEKNMVPILKRLQQIGLWERVFPELILTGEILFYLKSILKYKESNCQFFGSVDYDLIILLILCHQANKNQVEDFMEKYPWPKNYRRAFRKFLSLKQDLPFLLKSKNIPLSCYDKILGKLPNEVIIYLYLISNRAKQNMIAKYFIKRQECVMAISGNDLKLLGITPGPAFKMILNQVRAAKLDGRIQTRDDEIAYVKELMRKEEIKCHLEV